MFKEFKDAGIFPNVLTEGFKIHKEINEWTTKSCGLEPLDILVYRERPFLPMLIREAECNIVRKTIILHEKLNIFAAFWAIDKVWAAPFKNLIPAFCEDALEAVFVGPFSKFVVIRKLGIAKNFATYAK